MTTPGTPSDSLHQVTFSTELPTTANEDLPPSHSLKDNSIIESNCEGIQSSPCVKGSTITLLESSTAHQDLLKNDMLLEAPQPFLGQTLQESQELFHNVLEPTPQDFLLNDLEPRTQELLLHDIQPSHNPNFPTQEQLQGFGRTSRERDEQRISLSLPAVDSLLTPLQQDLVTIRGSSAEFVAAAATSHLPPSLEYSDITYAAEAVTSLVIPTSPSPKMAQRLREKKSKIIYKHVPHREKPQHLVARRNARERRRVQSVNVAFSRLRRVVPGTSGRSKRVSKVKTLQGAMDYITHLQALLQDPPDLCHGDFPPTCTPVPYSAYVPSVRIQVFRDTASSIREPSSVQGDEDAGHDHRHLLESTTHIYGGTCWDDHEGTGV